MKGIFEFNSIPVKLTMVLYRRYSVNIFGIIQQVAPAELEALILSHPDVDDVAVIGIPDREAGEVPRAYVVVKRGRQLTADQVKKHVAGQFYSFINSTSAF